MLTVLAIVVANLVGMAIAYGCLWLNCLMFPLEENQEPLLVLPLLFWPVTIFICLWVFLFTGLFFLAFKLHDKLSQGLKNASAEGRNLPNESD